MLELIICILLMIPSSIIIYLITELNIAKEENKFLKKRIEYERRERRLDDSRR